jgi:hypothetical protein
MEVDLILENDDEVIALPVVKTLVFLCGGPKAKVFTTKLTAHLFLYQW